MRCPCGPCPSSCAPTSCSPPPSPPRCSRSPSRLAPSCSPGSRGRRATIRSSWPCRRPPTPSASPTTCAPTWAPTRSTSSPPGRRSRSSGSAPASRRWAVACVCCGACATRRACPGCSWRRFGRWCSGWAPTSRTWSPSCSKPARGASTRPSWPRCSLPPATAVSTRWSTGARWRCAARSSTSSRPRPPRRYASTCGTTRSTA